MNEMSKLPLFQFLDEHIVESGKIHTHTSMFKPKGSYYINNNELETFYNLYNDALKQNIGLHITEKHNEISPILIDIFCSKTL